MFLTKDYEKYKNDIFEMLESYSKVERLAPYSLRRLDYQDFDNYLNGLKEEQAGLKDYIPTTTYFLYDEENNKMLGAVSIRHYLNDHLFLTWGHLGTSIRPDERKKGYGTLIIQLALKECLKLNINEVLLVCDKRNIASAKTIIKNGGILENEVMGEKGETLLRYWIK